MNLISVTFLPEEKTPNRFQALTVPSYINLDVVSKTDIVPLRVPTTSRSPSKLKAIELITSLISTQSITVLCLIDHIQVILSKLPVAIKSSLQGEKEIPVTTEGIVKMYKGLMSLMSHKIAVLS